MTRIHHRRSRTLAVTVAIAALSLLAAGCGGGGAPGVANVPSTTAPGAAGSATAHPSAMLLAGRCLRRNGLPNLPDPTIATEGPAKGQPVLDKAALHAFPDSVVSHATLVCHAVLAQAGIGNGEDVRTPQQIQDGLAFARCVRSHGISNFPDPNGQGQFNLAGTGINEHALTPAQLAAARACLSAGHGAVHIPTQGGATASNGG
ncbi:MAG TPA: hypothetical protein VNF07_06255 [Acidimicrobiales bacterium]|nr:hypothetical protein [Acidimicrobiales bacterium]